jgi:F0F1-type ATP synthase membrane subunit b/b'
MTMTDQEKHNALFVSLLLMFHSAAMQYLGKVKNPATDKIERNLEQAQAIIDMFDMLKEKTKGNLNNEEDKFLANLSQELKLNYVDEASKPEPTTGEPK